MKAFKSLICFVLAIAMVLTMSTMIFAVEEPKVYLAIGDSVSLGVKDGEYACSFTRVSGSSVDLLAKKLDMPVMPFTITATRISDFRELYEPDYNPEYEYYRGKYWIAQAAAASGKTFNEAGEMLREWTGKADLISMQIGTTDLLYAVVMDCFWHLEEMIGFTSELTKYTTGEYVVNKDEVFAKKSSSRIAEQLPEGLAYEGVVPSTYDTTVIDKYKPENFDLEVWFKAVEEEYFGESSSSSGSSSSSLDDFDIEQIIEILTTLYEIASGQGQEFLAEFLAYVAECIVGRIAQYEVDYRAVIDDIKELNPDAPVILVSETCPFVNMTLYEDIPFAAKEPFIAAFEELNEDLKRLANEKGCLYVDGSDCSMGNAVLDTHTVFSYLIAEYTFAMNDLCAKLHPSEADYAMVAERMYKVYTDYLAGTYEEPEVSGVVQACLDKVEEIENKYNIDFSVIIDFAFDFSSMLGEITSMFSSGSSFFSNFRFSGSGFLWSGFTK